MLNFFRSGKVKKIQKDIEGVGETLMNDAWAAVLLWVNINAQLLGLGEKDQNLIKEDLVKMRQQLTGEQVQKLWQALFSVKPETLFVMEQQTASEIVALQKDMMRNIEVIKHISNEQLIACAQPYESSREIFIALIRRYLLEKEKADPLAVVNYETLQIGGPEQNYLYLAGLVNQCDLLPVEAIFLLAKKDQTIATHILKDLTGNFHYFEISARIAEIYPSLRPIVARTWKDCFVSFPFTEEQKTIITPWLTKLQQYAEFKDVDLDSRIPRFYAQIYQKISPELLDKTLAAVNVFAMSLWLAREPLQYIALGASMFSNAPPCTFALAGSVISPWLFLPVAAYGGTCLLQKYCVRPQHAAQQGEAAGNNNSYSLRP